MLLTKQFVYRQYIALNQRRQFAALLFFGIIHVFHVHTDKAGKYQHLTVGAEQRVVTAQADVGADRVITGRRHLAGQRTFPDHFIQTGLIDGQAVTQAVRGAQRWRSGVSLHAIPVHFWSCSCKPAACRADSHRKNYL